MMSRKLSTAMEMQSLITIGQNTNLRLFRELLEHKNKTSFFDENKFTEPEVLQIKGVTMLFLCLEKNSDLVCGTLKHLNELHKYHSSFRFTYEPDLMLEIRFNNFSDTFMDDFLLTLYACLESPFNSARQEALNFFEYWILDPLIARRIFKRITNEWPWTNRNKYYFLSIIFDKHSFYELLDLNDEMDPTYFLNGVAISLQYRNLISPGQTLAIGLTKQEVPEMFLVIADVLRNGPAFELQNCINHWMRCIYNSDRVFDLLMLSSKTILDETAMPYLHRDNHLRLVLFRQCFKQQFERLEHIAEIDAFIKAKSGQFKLVHKIPMIEVIITRSMTNADELNENLDYLERFLKANMMEECSALRNDILKLMPNLLYLLATHLKCGDTVVPRIKQFFQFIKMEIWQVGIQEHLVYQPLIFSLKLFEIMLKTLYGGRGEGVIKKYNPAINDKLKAMLCTEDKVWELCALDNFNYLLALLTCHFDDVREIASELLIRFFQSFAKDVEMPAAIFYNQDIHQCSYAHHLVRVVINSRAPEVNEPLYQNIRSELRKNCENYQDPLLKVKAGQHFYGAANCLSEFYTMAQYRYDGLGRSQEGNSTPVTYKIFAPIEMREDIDLVGSCVQLLLKFFKFGWNAEEIIGSPSFEKMDGSLTMLVESSSYRADNLFQNKNLLLLSTWMSLKACCELASNIGIYMITQSDSIDESAIKDCFNVISTVLMQCRHKGAIEAAGFSMSKLIRCITSKYSGTTEMYKILMDSVNSIFDMIKKTNTTRRGAGFSIMIHSLVKSERNKERPLMIHVMKNLLERASEKPMSPEHINRDNVLASVLHFLCVLVKDGELKAPLTCYMVDIFSVAIGNIKSNEWTVRNASLQLFGAIVPKLVGQSQYFENTIDWDPVYTVYSDITIKMHKIHEHIVATLKQCSQPSILLVTLLELLSRIESIGSNELEENFQEKFYKYLTSDSEKVRTLAGKCLTRFYKFYEIPLFLRTMVPMVFQTNDNAQHGLIMTMISMLKKYESDSRNTQFAERNKAFLMEIKCAFRHYRKIDANRHCGFYVKYYLFDLLVLVGFNARDPFIMDIMFDSQQILPKDVEMFLTNLKGGANGTDADDTQFGFSIWKRKMLQVYCRKCDKDG